MFRFYVAETKPLVHMLHHSTVSGGAFSLTARLVNICLSDESDNDSLFRSVD